MKSFRALDLSVEFYEMSERSEVKGSLREQLLRAASSISLNLSEGNGKFSAKEKKRFYKMAYVSLKECQTILRLSKISGGPIVEKADRLGARLYKPIQSKITAI